MTALTFPRAGVLALISIALLAGCATRAPMLIVAPEVLAATPSARGLTQWQSEGKAGVTFLGNNFPATYSWKRNGNDFDADAAGPFNQGYTTLAGRKGRFFLKNDALGYREFDHPDELAQSITGIPLPVHLLNTWLIGWPEDPLTVITKLSGEQGVRLFKERGWQIRVLSEQVQDGYRVPQRLLLTYGNNRILVFIRRWQITPSS